MGIRVKYIQPKTIITRQLGIHKIHVAPAKAKHERQINGWMTD